MAKPPICSVPDCGKAAEKRGWCAAHYKRWLRHGDPLAGRTANGKAMEFLQRAFSYDGDDCLIWPYAKSDDGYGRINLRGRSAVVSRLVCEETHGAPPSPHHEAAHSCGNGTLGCITKRHLSWKTSTENNSDRLLHGTSNRGERHPMVKLSEDAVREVYSDARTYEVIAAEHGISVPTVSDIKRRKSWFWLPMTP